MRRRLPSFGCWLPAAVVLTACAADTTTAATQAEALLGAQCTFTDFHAAAQACFDTYDACVQAAGTDVEACRAALHECLPPPPERPLGPPPDGRDGHDCNPDLEGPGGLPPPPPDFGEGEAPPPPPPLPDGGVRPPPPDGPHRDGHRPPPPLPDPAAIAACREALNACIDANPTEPNDCAETERACVGEAFRAAFEARCAEAATRCAEPDAPAEPCADIAARCAQGVDGLAPGATCQ